MTIVKNIFLITLSFCCAFLIHRLITAELITGYLYISQTLQPVVHLGAILVQGIVIYLITKQIVNRKIDRDSIFMLWGCYFLILFVLLFLRHVGVRGVDLNPLSFLQRDVMDTPSVLFLVMNIVFFIPIGYLLKNRGYLLIFAFTILLELFIETAQYILALGFFDVGDIVLNMIGIYIGYFYFKKQKTPSIE